MIVLTSQQKDLLFMKWDQGLTYKNLKEKMVLSESKLSCLEDSLIRVLLTEMRRLYGYSYASEHFLDLEKNPLKCYKQMKEG